MHENDSAAAPKQGGRPPVAGIDFTAARWAQRRAIKLWAGVGGSGAWYECCARARAEYRLGRWLDKVFRQA